ncbi:amidase [Eisenibacter elegans]|uniref:amidase n=1 Tax=Eisenibacter elegans TaxID=997 RepID=UPI00041A5116|nr:amidase [Eisenibacter elegans]
MRKNTTHWFTLVLLTIFSFVAGGFFFRSLDDTLSPKDVQHAQRLLGLSFSEAKIDSMLDGLTQQRAQYERNRQQPLDNSLWPALLFNPLPVGFTPQTEQKPLVYKPLSGVKLPTDLNELAFYSVRELAALIQSKQISSEALTKFFLERLKRHNEQLYCVITLTESLALAQARAADTEIAAGKYRGPLHGIPYAVKDLLATKGYKTTWGSVPYQEQMIDADASVVQQMQEAGAVLVAKLSLGELAWGDVWFGGLTRNPWNLAQGASGSSAGSAAAVAAGLVPFAIGTETLGSIVSPSTVCGVTGLRPTYGRVSRYGAMALSWSMDKIGPMARHAEDCAVIFAALHGADERDPTLIPAAFNYHAQRPLAGLKVGYVQEAFASEYGFKTQDEATLRQLEALGVTLVPVNLPPLPDISFILWAEAAAAFDELTRSNQDDLLVRQIKQAWPNYFRMARFVPAVEYIQANRLRTQLIADMQALMQTVDLLVAPSWAGNTLTLTNLTGHPCVVLPNGFSPLGTPTSITLIGQLFGEADILRLADALQEVTDFHRQHPKAFLK